MRNLKPIHTCRQKPSDMALSETHLLESLSFRCGRFHLVSHSETLYRLKSLFQSPIFHGDKRISRIYPPQPKLVVVKWDLANLPIFLWIFSIWVFWSVTKQWPEIRRNTYKDVLPDISTQSTMEIGVSYHGPIHQFVLKSWGRGRGRFHPIHLLLCRGQWVGLPAMNFDSKVLEGFGLKQG